MNTVYRASSVEQADIVVSWLAEQGIAAFVQDRFMVGSYATLAVAPRGIQVCVPDDQAERAKALLSQHEQEAREKRTLPDKMFTTICPECGRRIEFPGELYGTVQSCPGCRQHVDVVEPPQYC